MAHVAKEMERQGFHVPLLIGGATTSRVHTAVKIEPNYSGTTVWVPDASRSVGVCTSLLSKELHYLRKVKDEAEKTRSQHKGKKGQGPHYPIAEARRHGLKTDWQKYVPPVPALTGIKVFRDYPLAEIAEVIDWTPFFQTWELAGALSGHPAGQGRGRGGAQPVRRRAENAGADHRGKMARRRGRDRIVSPQRRG